MPYFDLFADMELSNLIQNTFHTPHIPLYLDMVEGLLLVVRIISSPTILRWDPITGAIVIMDVVILGGTTPQRGILLGVNLLEL